MVLVKAAFLWIFALCLVAAALAVPLVLVLPSVDDAFTAQVILGASAAAGFLMMVAVRQPLFFYLRFILKSLLRNPMRTALTGAATMLLVFIVTLVWTVLW